MGIEANEVTRLLEAWNQGDGEALDQLMPLILDDVRRMAGRHLRDESPASTWQPTALVNEVYLRLHGCRTVSWKNRRHFFRTLAGMMRRILVDHARRRLSTKRGSGAVQVPLEDVELRLSEVRAPDLVALDDALVGLAALDARKCQVVELRFFFGLTHPEIARVLDISSNTVDRDWSAARLWLRRELSRAGTSA